MTQKINFPLTEIARAKGSTRDEMVSWILTHLSGDSAPFNYLTATRTIKSAYRGLNKLSTLLSGCSEEKNLRGRLANESVVMLAAPIAFGRNLQVFDLPARRFQYGRDKSTGFRVPFFFTEKNVVKIYFLQPRKFFSLSLDELEFVATVHKKYLLDIEFYGLQTDVEYVDISAIRGTKDRSLKQYSLPDLMIWNEKRFSDHLVLVAEALDYIQDNDLSPKRSRNVQPIAGDMPLFD